MQPRALAGTVFRFYLPKKTSNRKLLGRVTNSLKRAVGDPVSGRCESSPRSGVGPEWTRVASMVSNPNSRLERGHRRCR
jgi:hypothetical protein